MPSQRIPTQSSALQSLTVLLWLKWKLMIRGYLRNTTALVGVILAVLFLLPLSIGIGIGAGAAFWLVHPPFNEHILRAILLFLWLLWVVTPLFGYSLNEAYDVTRLFIYPISNRQIFLATIIGSVVDFTVILLFPLLVAIIVGFTRSPISFLLAGVAVVLFLFHTLVLGQALMLASSSLLNSRKSKDLMMVLGPVLGFGIYIFFRSMSEWGVKVDWGGMLKSRTWDVANYLPAGLAARAIGSASRGDYLLSIGFILVLGALTAVAVLVAGSLLQTAYSGESGGRVRPVAKPADVRVASHRRKSLLPAAIGAMFEKEMKYFRRDPYFKLTLVSVVYVVAIMVLGIFQARSFHGVGEAGGVILWASAGYVIMMETGLLFNSFGTEGPASALLFSYPASRRDMLIGKNLALWVALMVINTLILLIPVAFLGLWIQALPVLLWLGLALLTLAGVGNLVSVAFPMRIIMKGGRPRAASAGRGCGFALLYSVLSFGSMALLAPVLAALLVPSFWFSSALYVFTIPFAVVYSGAIYFASLHFAEPMLLEKEIGMVEKLSAEDS